MISVQYQLTLSPSKSRTRALFESRYGEEQAGFAEPRPGLISGMSPHPATCATLDPSGIYLSVGCGGRSIWCSLSPHRIAEEAKDSPRVTRRQWSLEIGLHENRWAYQSAVINDGHEANRRRGSRDSQRLRESSRKSKATFTIKRRHYQGGGGILRTSNTQHLPSSHLCCSPAPTQVVIPFAEHRRRGRGEVTLERSRGCC